MNSDHREKRIEHARAYLNKAIEQDANIAIGAGVFACMLIMIFIFALCTEGTDIFTDAIGALLLMALLIFLCGGLIWVGCFDEIPKYKKLLQDVEGKLEEIEKLEAEAKKRIQKSKSTSSGGAYHGDPRSLADRVYGEHGWRKTIPHSEYTKYHIRLEDYETEFEYEDALRRAKSHYDKLHK